MPTPESCSGRTTWCAHNTANCPTPAYADGYIFWSNGYGKGGICLKLKREGDKIAADTAWTAKDMVCHHGGYIIHEGYIYGNHDNGWACLDLKTGQRKWFEKLGKGSLCFADGMLYLFSENGGQAAPGHLLAGGPGSEREGQGQRQGAKLGPSGRRRRAALPPLRHQPLLLRRETKRGMTPWRTK